MAYVFAATDPETAVELLVWVFASADTALQWVRQWPLFERLQAQLHAVMDRDSYQVHWETGKALTSDAIHTYLHHEFSAESVAVAEAAQQQILTAREREILGLMAAGMTNPQIAAQLVNRHRYRENPRPHYLPQAGGRQPHAGDPPRSGIRIAARLSHTNLPANLPCGRYPAQRRPTILNTLESLPPIEPHKSTSESAMW